MNAVRGRRVLPSSAAVVAAAAAAAQLPARRHKQNPRGFNQQNQWEFCTLGQQKMLVRSDSERFFQQKLYKLVG